MTALALPFAQLCTQIITPAQLIMPASFFPPEAPLRRGGVFPSRPGRPRCGALIWRGETWGPAIALVPRPIDPTYLRSARVRCCCAKGGDEQAHAHAWRGKQDDWRGRGRSCGQGWRKKMIGGIPHYGSHRPMTSPGALVEAGSRSAGRRREGAAAGQSGRALGAGPVRDQEGRSTVSSLTMGSPAVQVPRAARRSTCWLEEARWSSDGAAAAGQ